MNRCPNLAKTSAIASARGNRHPTNFCEPRNRVLLPVDRSGQQHVNADTFGIRAANQISVTRPMQMVAPRVPFKRCSRSLRNRWRLLANRLTSSQGMSWVGATPSPVFVYYRSGKVHLNPVHRRAQEGYPDCGGCASPRWATETVGGLTVSITREELANVHPYL